MLERSLGEAIMSQGRRDPTYVDDTELSQYLTTMGRKLATYSPGAVPEVEMFGVRDPEINAFAMPGGFIGVNTGLIVASASESELAAVLAHEIGHVVQRHIARGMTQQNQNSMVMLASLAGALLAALAGGGGNLAMGVAAFGQAAAINRQLGFSRDAEREADRAGFQMLTKAGYDPQGMSDMFGRLMNASRLNEGMGGGSWASTHPLSIERMSDVQNRARSQPPTRHVDSDDFWYIRAKMRVVQGATRSVCARPRSNCRTRPGAVRRAQVGGLLWPGLAGPAAQQPGRGGAQLDPGLGRRTDVAAAGQAERGYRAGPQGQCPRAGAGAGRVRWPDRRALGIAYAQALQNGGRHAEAQDYLRGKIRQWGADEPSLYQMLAQSQERTGKPVQARRDMARYYTQIGAFAAAESQLQQARGMSSDFYEQSQIDVQIKEVKDKLAEERQLLERFKSG